MINNLPIEPKCPCFHCKNRKVGCECKAYKEYKVKVAQCHKELQKIHQGLYTEYTSPYAH